MSDTKTGDEKTLSVNTKKTLTLKRPGMDQGTVRQNFSHGRVKQVVVETKKRKFARPEDKPEAAPAPSVVVTAQQAVAPPTALGALAPPPATLVTVRGRMPSVTIGRAGPVSSVRRRGPAP